MFKKLLAGLVLIVAVLAIVIAVQKEDYSISRSATMVAPPQAPFDQINDFSKWPNWSPWEKLDPNIKRTFEGPQSGTGAIYKWTGNNDVGEGKMTIVDSKPGESLKMKLEFIKPMPCVCDTLFTFTPEGDKTVVTWTMSGKNNFVGKGFHLFMDMDKICGDQFNQGLANLKKTVETPAAL